MKMRKGDIIQYRDTPRPNRSHLHSARALRVRNAQIISGHSRRRRSSASLPLPSVGTCRDIHLPFSLPPRAPWRRRSAPPPRPSPLRRPSGLPRAGSPPSSACACAPPRAPTPPPQRRGRLRLRRHRGGRAGGSRRRRLPRRRSVLGQIR